MSSPLITVLGFHDGPTEGFVRGIEGAAVCFFKVVAWDKNQDRRLYLLGKVDERRYEELFAILKGSERPLPMIWTPIWKFDDANLEVRANTIVEEARRSLAAPAILALGENLLDSYVIMTPSDEQLNMAIALARASCPENLDVWLALS